MTTPNETTPDTSAASSAASFAPSTRTRLKRHAERGNYERAVVHAIIDEALICHVAYVLEGEPFVLPTAHARIGDDVYLHGAQSNRMLRALLGGRAALSFTLIDGLVFARSAFSHSMNFRSVTAFGSAEEVSDPAQKRLVLAALLDHLAPGRAAEARAPSDEELKTTLVLRVPIEEAAAKTRSGLPLDKPSDAQTQVWSGVLPLQLTAASLRHDPRWAEQQPISPAVAARAAQLGAPLDRAVEWRRAEYLVSSDKSRLDRELVQRFLSEESYWANGISAEAHELAFRQSLCLGLYVAGRQIGFARVVSDLTRIAYLADVFVLASERGQGLGSWLVECALAHPALAHVQRWLLGTRDAQTLYERFGFRATPAGRYMVRGG